jgi:hypothetical protein
MSDIIERLNMTLLYEGSGEASDLPEEAADELRRLTAENEALRAVLAEAREALETLFAELDEQVNRLYGGEMPCSDEQADALDRARDALARIAALDVPAQQEDCPHCSKRVSACSCEDPTTTYVAETPEAEPEWVRIENEARARDGRPLHPGPIPRSVYKNNPYADD